MAPGIRVGATMHGSVNNTGEIAEVVWSLKFSKIFFDAFQIDVDRVAQWRFLTFLLRFESGSKISVIELTGDDEFRKFLRKTGRRTEDYVFKEILVANFRNEHGSFLDLPKSQKQDRALTLNAHFHAAVKSYLTHFIDLMSEGNLTWNIHSANQEQILKRFKTLINFQNKRYYPPWLDCIGKLADLAKTDGLSKKEIADDLEAHAPYWSLLLSVWRKHLGDTQVSTTSSGLWRAVFDTMRGADPVEVKNCLAFLTGKGGPNILKEEKIDGRIFHRLLPKFESVLGSYVSELIAARPQLLGELQSIVDEPEVESKTSSPAGIM
jgi:hypothetical protein